MSFEFTCPFCLSRTKVAEEYLGQSGPCAHCGRPVVMPTRDRQGRLVHAVQTGRAIETKREDAPTENSAHDDRGLLRTLVSIATISLIALLAIGAVVGLPMFRKQMSIAAQSSDLERMRAIVKALNAYCDRYGTYPPPQVLDPAGKPLLSWRVLILPFMGYGDLYEKFALNQAWDSPLNLLLMQRMPKEFSSSNSPDAWGNKQTNFVLITGAGTLFPPSGPMGRKQVGDVPTLLVVETTNGGSGWTEPTDIDLAVAPASFGYEPMQSIGGLHSQVALGVDTQGNSVIMPKDISQAELDGLISPNGGDPNASKDWSVYP